MNAFDTAAEESIREVFINPIVAAAFLALVGVLITQMVFAWSRRKQYEVDLEALKSETIKLENETVAASNVHELEALKASVDVLRSEYDRLSSEVKELREEMIAEREAKREYQERYSVSIGFLGSLLASATTLFSRLDREEVSHAPLPDIPIPLRNDLYQGWPELKTYLGGEEHDV